MVPDNTPVIVGVGQFTERLTDPAYVGLSPAELAARACEAAIADAGGGLRERVGMVGAIRTFEDSRAGGAQFGKPDKFPLAVARRIGVEPQVALLEKVGGQSPLSVIADLAERMHAGVAGAALVFGAEAISTVRHLKARDETRDWSETLPGEMEDHGFGLEGLITRANIAHGIVGAPAAYALIENARRARLGLSRDDYARDMGELFAPFTRVAAENPYSASEIEPMSAEEIARVSERNRMIAEPYRLKMVSRDQVNQGAAILLTTVGEARRAGVPEANWIFVHAATLVSEPDIILRQDIGGYAAARLSLEGALEIAGKRTDDIALFDFYSCFPTAVFSTAVDVLGLSPDDPRGLTVTGGLPFFGGAGNNYSTHAIATMTERLRERPGAFGLVGLNGGFQSKYGTVILSTEPAEWPGCDRERLQVIRDEAPPAAVAHQAEGWGRILTYTVVYTKGLPSQAIVIGELESGERFLANNADRFVLDRMVTRDPIGARIYTTALPEGNRFAFDREAIRAAYPRVKPGFQDSYEFVLVRRDGHLLEVTINRPDARNSLPRAAHIEMAAVFDAYEADPDLWVAIITGAGDRAFCAGADLKLAREGGAMPFAGFAGLTNRTKRKPVIAAVNGFAFGGGFETVLACEMAVADPSATFALSEVKVGVVAAMGGAVRLQRQAPRKIAYELLLTGRSIDAQDALRYGCVNRISEPGEVMAAARELAAEIIAASPTSVRLTMQVMREAEAYADADEATRASLNSSAIDDMLVSQDCLEGSAAFVQKRPPQWKNR
jgi:acetyl-CoA C-acetyltransferase